MGSITKNQGLAAVVLFSLQFISQNSLAYVNNFGAANAYNATLNANLSASIGATNNFVSQQASIQASQLQANLNASFAQQAVTAQRTQAMITGNFSSLGQYDMASSQIAQQQAQASAAAGQATQAISIQNMQTQAAIQRSNLSAMTQFSRVVDSAIYSAGMSGGETGRIRNGSSVVSEPGDKAVGMAMADGSWSDPSDDGSDWFDPSPGTSSGSGSTTFPSAEFYQGNQNGISQSIGSSSQGIAVNPIAAQSPAGRGIGGFESGTWFDPHDDGSDYYDALEAQPNVTRMGFEDALMGQLKQAVDGAQLQNFHTTEKNLINDITRNAVNSGDNYAIMRTIEALESYKNNNDAAVNSVVDGTMSREDASGIYRSAGDNLISRLQEINRSAADGRDTITRSVGAQNPGVWERSFDSYNTPNFFIDQMANQNSVYTRGNQGEFFGDSKIYDLNLRSEGLNGQSPTQQASGMLIRAGFENGFSNFSNMGAMGGPATSGYTSLTYNNVGDLSSSFSTFAPTIERLGGVATYGTSGQIQAVTFAPNTLVGQSVVAQASYNPWARDAEAKALDLAVRGIGVGKAGMGGVELQGNVTASQAISCVDAGAKVQNAGLFRFHMESTGEHFITSSLQEGCSVGFKFEKVAFKLLDKADGMKPLYRCWTTKNHFISDRADCEGHQVEGLMGYASAKPAAGLVPLHRGIHAIGDILATIDWNELDLNLYQYQGVLGYVLPPGAATTVASK